MMKVIIAGTNGLALRIAQYLERTHHSCVLLTTQPTHPMVDDSFMAYVNYSDENRLVFLLSGNDLVISMVTGNDQLLLIDAALKAGVTRFVPAEFDSPPSSRPSYPALDRDRRLVLNRLRDHAAEGMEYTIVICGLLYERLGPDGLQSVNMGNIQGANGGGDFLMDQYRTKADIPTDQAGKPAVVCMTSMDDVARFLVAALEIPNWPREFYLRGERKSIRDIIALVEEVHLGHQIEAVEQNSVSLRSRLQYAEELQDKNQILRLSLLLAIAEGQYDYSSTNLNDAVQIQSTPLRMWLRSIPTFGY